ncbi:MAG: glycosyltransferase family 4 protein [Planococcus citreus]
MKKKNVWVFHHYATPPNKNGFTRPYSFSQNMNKEQYKTTIFAASYLHFADENLIKNDKAFITEEYNNTEFVYLKTPSSVNGGMARVNNMLAYYRKLFQVTKIYDSKHKKPDIIIASSPHPLALIAGIKIAKKMNVPCICEIRDLWPETIFAFGKVKENSILGKALTKGEHWIYKNADALIFLKEGDTDYIKERGWTVEQGGEIDLRKCHYINNGVNLTDFEKQSEENSFIDQDLLGEKFNVVYAGAIRPINNVGNILDTAKLLIKNKDIQFLIYGDGNQLEYLKKRVVNEELSNVKLKGYVDKQYIPFILMHSSLNILNYSQTKYNWSRGNSSNKLFEYMASGKPIISTMKMGYSPIEKYNCGISLESDTSNELASAVMDMYNMENDKYLHMGNNAKVGAKDFDYKILTQKLIKVMGSLV